VLKNLKSGGYLIISLTESIKNLPISELTQLDASIYQKEEK